MKLRAVRVALLADYSKTCMAKSISLEFAVWFSVVTTILGGGMAAMILAYRRPFKNAILFPAAIQTSSIPLATHAETQFRKGCRQFAQGRFLPAIRCFIQVVDMEPKCAEAFHNLGLAYANLGNDDYAVQALLKANEFYDQQDSGDGVVRILAQMEQLAGRRRDLSNRSVGSFSSQNVPSPNSPEARG